jgi:hypothetical protein
VEHTWSTRGAHVERMVNAQRFDDLWFAFKNSNS